MNNQTAPDFSIRAAGGPKEPWVSNNTAQNILTYTHFAYPVILLVTFIGVFTYESITSVNDAHADVPAKQGPQLGPGGKVLPQRLAPKKVVKGKKDVLDFSRPRKLLFIWLSLGVLITFIGNGILTIMHALYGRNEEWWCGQAYVVYGVGSLMIFSLTVVSIIDTKPSPINSQLATWIVATVMEVILLGASFALYTTDHREPTVDDPQGGALERDMTQWEVVEVLLDSVRIVCLVALSVFYILFKVLQWRHERKKQGAARVNSDETATLLDHDSAENGTATGNVNGTAGNYGTNGTANGNANGNGTPKPVKKDDDDTPAGWEKPKGAPSRSWWEYIRGYSIFFPYLWPSKDRKLQIIVVICFFIMIAQRAVQVLVPMQAGRITDRLSSEEGQKQPIPWGSICLYIFYRLLQGNNGLLGALRGTIWVPVSQYSFRELSVASFEHVHSLSLDFHLGKKTGEVLSALGKGSAINNFLESVTFQVLPMLVDLCVAMAYFLLEFDAYYALVVAVITFWYIYLTIRMAQWRANIRRQMVDADREVDAVKNDSMVSYETVKYFNAERYEFDRYRVAVEKYQKAEYGTLFSLNIMNVAQNCIFMVGLMVACFVSAYQVSRGQLRVGQFVILLTYMAQLQQPLNFFGTFYRMIQQSMINSERMLELFKEQATVVDSPGAKEIPSCKGDIRFKNVQFAYDERKPALSGLDFHCPPGTTTAFVGESGGGKSTVFRLLFRYYNSTSGSMQLDGHDIEHDVTIDSVRRHIGVVPQDTVLFNETLMYNLKYANPSCTDEQVFEACRAASIHDKILTFPDGYETKVGERGLRLSGGEKQRVAIARTILKDPRIILLDEATAALDTETEEHIQEALSSLSQGRTMLMIAHRLSTITMADQILVLHQGRCVERGTHDELLALKGRYASMWRKQVRAQRAAEHARVFRDKAERLRRESHDASGGHSTDNGSSEDEEVQAQIRAETLAASQRARASSKSGSAPL